MNIATAVSLADSWPGDVGTGWVIAMAVMMVICMGAMMFGMSWMMGGRGGRSDRRRSTTPWDRFMGRESPVETLERRFAAGEISPEDYRARREVLVNGHRNSQAQSDQEDEPLTSPREARR